MRSHNILIKVETPWWQVVRGWTGRASPRLRDPYELSTERGERKKATQCRQGERERERGGAGETEKRKKTEERERAVGDEEKQFENQ